MFALTVDKDGNMMAVPYVDESKLFNPYVVFLNTKIPKGDAKLADEVVKVLTSAQTMNPRREDSFETLTLEDSPRECRGPSSPPGSR